MLITLVTILAALVLLPFALAVAAFMLFLLCVSIWELIRAIGSFGTCGRWPKI